MDQFMQVAIDEAKTGLEKEGIPIGAVLVQDNKVIGRGYQRRAQEGHHFIHAEIECLRNAGRLDTYQNTILYSTLMPNSTCATALVRIGILKIVVGSSRSFGDTREFLERKGVEVIDLSLPECTMLMGEFVEKEPDLTIFHLPEWNIYEEEPSDLQANGPD
jgi:cytosine/creatinine deaminase